MRALVLAAGWLALASCDALAQAEKLPEGMPANYRQMIVKHLRPMVDNVSEAKIAEPRPDMSFRGPVHTVCIQAKATVRTRRQTLRDPRAIQVVFRDGQIVHASATHGSTWCWFAKHTPFPEFNTVRR